MAIFLRNFPDVDGKTLMTRTAIKYKQRLEAAILITVETRAEANRSVDRGIGQNEKLKKKERENRIDERKSNESDVCIRI